MKALKAHVKNGHVVLDEPSNLPDGSEVNVVLLDDDELDEEERAALHESILVSEAELDAGQSVDTQELLARLETQS